MLKSPQGIWGYIQKKYDIELLPLSYRVKAAGKIESNKTNSQGSG